MVEPAVAISFKFRIGDLIAEFLAHAEVVFGFLQSARAVALALSETCADAVNYFLVLVYRDLHGVFGVKCKVDAKVFYLR